MPPFTLESLFITCVTITLICLLLQCLCSLFSAQEIPKYTPSYHVPTPSLRLENRARIQRPYYRSDDYNQAQYEYTGESGKQVIALDTESVGGPGGRSMVARVSMVRRDGKVWDRYVKPSLPIMDYRTPYSGIRERDLVNAVDYSKVRWVASIIEDCILVGHDLKHDLNVLNLTHPVEDIRDTSEYEPFRKMVAAKEAQEIVESDVRRKSMNMSHYDPFEMVLWRVQAMSKAEQMQNRRTSTKPKLSLLAHHLLGRDIQIGEHSSLEDARAALDLYLLVEEKWEEAVAYNDY